MIHVDVKQAQPDDWRRGFNIEVSVDGGPFVNHWFLATRGKNEVEARLSAASDGRIYAAGIKFGGGDVRMTAFGNDVYVPDMSTIVADIVRARNAARRAAGVPGNEPTGDNS